MKKLSISNLIIDHADGIYYSFYDGNLSPWEIFQCDDEITEEMLDKFNYGDYRKDLVRVYSANVLPVLKKYLEPYGYKVEGMELYSPREYNFESDSFDMVLDTSGVDMDAVRTKLIGEIEKYWLDVRKPSCDGYTSLEPDRIEEFGPSDYGTIWAIFEHENAWEDLKDAHDGLENGMGGISEIAYNNL